MTAVERDEEKESEILPFAEKIKEANRCAQHPGNNLGCYVTHTANHIAITLCALNIWAVGLQRGQPGITERHPPPTNLFENETKKSRARTVNPALESQSPRLLRTYKLLPFRRHGILSSQVLQILGRWPRRTLTWCHGQDPDMGGRIKS
jgi:hypothetical protein